MSHLLRKIANLFKIGNPTELKDPVPNVSHASVIPPHQKEARESRVGGPNAWA